MHGRCLLRRGQIRHFLHIGPDRRGQLRGHGLVGHLARLGLLVVHRQDERAIAPGRPIALVEQRLQSPLRRRHLPRYAQRCGIAPDQFGVIGRPLQRGLIVALRPGLIAGHVARQPAIRQNRRVGKTQPPRLIKQPHRLCRILQLQIDPRQPDLDPAIAAGDRIGTGEETRRRARIVERQRRLPRADQRIHVARIGRQPRQIAVEVGGTKGTDQLGLVGLRLGGSGHQQAAKNPCKILCHIRALADQGANRKSPA